MTFRDFIFRTFQADELHNVVFKCMDAELYLPEWTFLNFLLPANTVSVEIIFTYIFRKLLVSTLWTRKDLSDGERGTNVHL